MSEASCCVHVSISDKYISAGALVHFHKNYEVGSKGVLCWLFIHPADHAPRCAAPRAVLSEILPREHSRGLSIALTRHSRCRCDK